MADADKSLKLLIEMGVIGKDDVQAANDLLVDSGKASEQAAEGSGLLTEAKAGEAEATAAANEKHEATKLLFGQINKLVPGLGESLEAAFAGPLAPAILLVMAVNAVQEKLKAYNEELDKVPQEELAEHLANIARLKSSWDEAQLAVGKYHAELATAGEEKDPIKKQLDGIKAVNDAQLDAHKKEIESLGKIEVAWLRAHGGTPEQVAAAEDRTRSEVDGIDRRKESADGLDALQEEQKRRAAADAGLQADATAKQAAAHAATDKFEADQDELERLRKTQNPNDPLGKKLADERADDQRMVEKAGNLPDVIVTPGGPIDMTAANKKALQESEDELARASAQDAVFKKRISQLEGSESRRGEVRNTAQIQADLATGRTVQNQARLNELPDEISQAKTIDDAQEHARKVTEILNTHGGRLNETLGQLAVATGKTHEQTLNIVEGILSGHATLQQRMAQLEAQLKATGNRPQG